MKTGSFPHFAAWAAFFAAAAGLLYAVSFVVLKSSLLSAIFLLLGGLGALVAWIGLYQRFRDLEPAYALLALLLSLTGSLGSLIHGGYDLSNALHPPASLPTDLPSQIDPRGLLTFGVAALGLFFFSRLALMDKHFPAGLAYLGFASAVFLTILYLARLIILDASSLVILVPAALEGFLLNPIWYIWLGVVFLRGQ
jgi:hypothetical protein